MDQKMQEEFKKYLENVLINGLESVESIQSRVSKRRNVIKRLHEHIETKRAEVKKAVKKFLLLDKSSIRIYNLKRELDIIYDKKKTIEDSIKYIKQCSYTQRFDKYVLKRYNAIKEIRETCLNSFYSFMR